MSHFTIGWSFLELDTKFVESFTSLLDIVDANGDMTESSTWIRVSIGVSLEVGVRFSTVVVCELEYAFFFFVFRLFEEGDKKRKNKKKKNRPSRENLEAVFSSGVNSLPSWLNARK